MTKKTPGGRIGIIQLHGYTSCSLSKDTALNFAWENKNSGHHKVGDQVTLSLRPEKIMLSVLESNNDANQRPGKVTNLIYLGNQAAYSVDMGDGIQLTAQARPREDGELPFAIGDSIAVSFSTRAMRVLVE